jgi:hypothetical protein
MVLFAFFAAMAETERENIRDATLEGLTAAARKGIHGGRPPPVITADMLHTVLRRRANGESVEQIRPDLIIPTGKRKGQHPPARPASTGRLPSTTKRRRTPRPSTKPTPTSPPSRRVPDGPIIAGQPYPPDFRRLLRRPPVDPTTLQVRLPPWPPAEWPDRTRRPRHTTGDPPGPAAGAPRQDRRHPEGPLWISTLRSPRPHTTHREGRSPPHVRAGPARVTPAAAPGSAPRSGLPGQLA